MIFIADIQANMGKALATVRKGVDQIGTAMSEGLRGVGPKLGDVWKQAKVDVTGFSERIKGTSPVLQEFVTKAGQSTDRLAKGIIGDFRSLESSMDKLRKKGITGEDLFADAAPRVANALDQINKISDTKLKGQALKHLLAQVPIENMVGSMGDLLRAKVELATKGIHPETRLRVEAELVEANMRRVREQLTKELSQIVVKPGMTPPPEFIEKIKLLREMAPMRAPAPTGTTLGVETSEEAGKKHLGMLGKIGESLKAGFGPILTTIAPFRILAEVLAPVIKLLHHELMPLLFPIQEALLNLVLAARPLIYSVLLPLQQAMFNILKPVTAFVVHFGKLIEENKTARTIFIGVAYALGAIAIGFGVVKTAMWAAHVVMTVVKGAMTALAVVQWIFTGGLWAAVAATWAFTIALLANPITWIVIGVIAAIAGLLLIIEKFTGGVSKAWHWLVGGSPGLIPAIQFLGSVAKSIFGGIKSAVEVIGKVFQWLWDKVSPILSGIAAGLRKIREAADAVKDIIAAPFRAVASGARYAYHWIVGGSPGLIPALGQLAEVSKVKLGGMQDMASDLSDSLKTATASVGNPFSLIPTGINAVWKGISSLFGGEETPTAKQSVTEGPWGGGFGIRVPLKVQLVNGDSNTEVVNSLEYVEKAIKKSESTTTSLLQDIYAALTDGNSMSPTLARLGAME